MQMEILSKDSSSTATFKDKEPTKLLKKCILTMDYFKEDYSMAKVFVILVTKAFYE